MLLLTDPDAPMGFWSYPAWPRRKPESRPSGEKAGWREHPLAQIVDTLLAERGLDEWDVDLLVDEKTLWVFTACWAHSLRAGGADVAAILAPDLDHLRALRRREAMIAATVGTPDGGGSWVLPATPDASGSVGLAPSGAIGDAVPLWSVTASTALLAHLDRAGVSSIEAVRLAVAKPSDPDSAATWAELAGVRIHYEDGRLHAREFLGKHTLDDFYGLTLNLGGQSLPDSVMTAAAGRPLRSLVTLQARSALSLGLDPVMTAVKQVGSQWANAMAAGLLVHLEAGAETLADIPTSALEVVGVMRQCVPRWKMPWLPEVENR